MVGLAVLREETSGSCRVREYSELVEDSDAFWSSRGTEPGKKDRIEVFLREYF